MARRPPLRSYLGPVALVRNPARRRRWLWRSALAVLLATGVLASVLFVLPAGGAPHRADAVLVLGGAGPRIERAEQLARDGYVEMTVIATQSPEVCDPEVPTEQVCITPVPATTRGEARAMAELTRERGWDDVLVVVQNEQVFRAALRLRRCFDDDVAITFISVRAGPWSSATRTVHESLALPKALLWERSC